MLSFTVYYIVQRDEVGTLEDSRGHSFLKELRLICSFHHLGNDMAIKAYTIKCRILLKQVDFDKVDDTDINGKHGYSKYSKQKH